MTTLTVSPKPGDSKRWKVEENGRVISQHNKKKNAIQKARKRREARDGQGAITIQGRDGQFQRRI